MLLINQSHVSAGLLAISIEANDPFSPKRKKDNGDSEMYEIVIIMPIVGVAIGSVGRIVEHHAV